jgi:hypothetical protein
MQVPGDSTVCDHESKNVAGFEDEKSNLKYLHSAWEGAALAYGIA